MPTVSRMARLLQALVFTVVVLAALWWIAWWPARPLLAAIGAALILFGHAAVLAVEFVLMARVSRADPTPRPGALQCVRAWWRESTHNLLAFGWRQPFAWRRIPDQMAHGRRGIVFVHGFVCNRGFWTPWLRRARTQGHPFIAVNLEPVFGSIDGYAERIEEAVARLIAATGLPPLIVCHSMGGLAVRAWLRTHQATGRVAHIVTIGTPHRGTWLARFSRLPNGRQMRMDGDWLRALEQDAAPRLGLFTCWYSNCDNIVFPPAAAILPGADNRLVCGAAHVELAFRQAIVEDTFSLIQRRFADQNL